MDDAGLVPRKQELLNSLPVRSRRLTVRACTKGDLAVLSRWPEYPWPDDVFRFSFAGLPDEELEAVFQQRAADPQRLTLVADGPVVCAGYLALLQADFAAGRVGDMSVRIHPLCCSQGMGTELLKLVVPWCHGHGLRRIRLSVAATNIRALRLYHTAGFAVAEEFWQTDSGLSPADLGQPRYAFLAPHARLVDRAVQVRFWWMQWQAP